MNGEIDFVQTRASFRNIRGTSSNEAFYFNKSGEGMQLLRASIQNELADLEISLIDNSSKAQSSSIVTGTDVFQ